MAIAEPRVKPIASPSGILCMVTAVKIVYGDLFRLLILKILSQKMFIRIIKIPPNANPHKIGTNCACSKMLFD